MKSSMQSKPQEAPIASQGTIRPPEGPDAPTTPQRSMPAPPVVMPPEPKRAFVPAVHHIKITLPGPRKGRYVQAARKRGQSLSAWAIQAMDAHVKLL